MDDSSMAPHWLERGSDGGRAGRMLAPWCQVLTSALVPFWFAGAVWSSFGFRLGVDKVWGLAGLAGAPRDTDPSICPRPHRDWLAARGH